MVQWGLCPAVPPDRVFNAHNGHGDQVGVNPVGFREKVSRAGGVSGRVVCVGQADAAQPTGRHTHHNLQHTPSAAAATGRTKSPCWQQDKQVGVLHNLSFLRQRPPAVGATGASAAQATSR
jgi:hypothetical protein